MSAATSSSAPSATKVTSRNTTILSDTPGTAALSEEKLHIIDQPWTRDNWYQHFNWLNVGVLSLPPLLGLYGLLYVPLQMKTAVWAVVYYFMTGLGITAGYHRLWAHRSYSASFPLRLFLAAVGGGAVEGSIRWWSRDHRAHHRFTDTEKDPYSVRKGLLYSHLGWMLLKQNPKKIGRTDISDLNADPIVVWQHKNYIKTLFVMGFIFPTVVAGLCWGDWRGGFFYAAICRLVFVHHATFCVNSLAHWLGDQPFDDRHSPRDHVVTALVTLGEGYHNFHHTFPSDYRNAIRWWQYDPTKWVIWTCKVLGLASDLKQFNENAIQQGLVMQAQKKLDQRRSVLDWGIPIETLPIMSYDDFEEQSKAGKKLVLVAGVVHDVSEFVNQHPGGIALIRSGIGKDMTSAFNGGVYDHSNAAHNLLATMRVAVVRGGMEVEIWKQSMREAEMRERKTVDPPKDTMGQKIVRQGDQATKTHKHNAESVAAPAN
ncbi:stearoyl-CoA 9-desaturase [Saitoella coloradoensis]